MTERAAAPFLLEMHDVDVWELAGERLGERKRAVGARVVGDRELELERVRAESIVQRADAPRQHVLLVEDWNHDLDFGTMLHAKHFGTRRYEPVKRLLRAR